MKECVPATDLTDMMPTAKKNANITECCWHAGPTLSTCRRQTKMSVVWGVELTHIDPNIASQAKKNTTMVKPFAGPAEWLCRFQPPHPSGASVEEFDRGQCCCVLLNNADRPREKFYCLLQFYFSFFFYRFVTLKNDDIIPPCVPSCLRLPSIPLSIAASDFCWLLRVPLSIGGL